MYEDFEYLPNKMHKNLSAVPCRLALEASACRFYMNHNIRKNHSFGAGKLKSRLLFSSSFPAFS